VETHVRQVPVSLCDTMSALPIPWAEAHGYHP